MFQWLKSLFTPPQPVGPPVPLKKYSIADQPISRDSVQIRDGSWVVDFREPGVTRLFEIENPGVEQSMITYQARMKTEGLSGRAYLEMWCCFSQGEFFSRGFHHAVKGSNGWASYETPFYLKKGQRPHCIKLNLVSEGTGKVWMQEIEVMVTPLQ